MSERLASGRGHLTSALALCVGCGVVSVALPSFGQDAGVRTGSLERFQPSVPGDAMFGVPSPIVGGHLVPRAAVIADYAYLPLSIQDGDTRSTIVADQLFLHAAVSFALFDRVLLSADMPFAIFQTGDSPLVGSTRFDSPGEAQVGDLRMGARLRLYGDFWDPFQIGVGGHVFLPTGPSDSYAADGSVRGEPHLLVGGRTSHFVYSASLGTTLRGSARPHTFDARAGAALVLGESFFQIGPELTVTAPLSEDVVVDDATTRITAASPVGAELLLGAKVRVLGSLVIGAGAGPGLSQAWGTPVFFAAGSVAYEPLPPKKKGDEDADGDKILDPVDACPTVPGIPSDDPKKHGCPDTDRDGIFDAEDACPTVAGLPNQDPKKHGCPDTDKDGIFDAEDACPTAAGLPNDDPKRHGCPDTDKDGIFDAEDACPTVPGVRHDDPKKNGCPPDRDEDGIADAQDACPDQKGSADPDPKKNGCPAVTVTKTEIVINRQIQFKFGQSELDQTVDPVSDDLLVEVRDAIVNHPEIKLIEVQGHADTVGPESFNRSLSDRRAIVVRAWLVKRGIRPDKLVAKGYGSKLPKATNDSPEGRQENRRVQFLIIKQDETAPEKAP